MQQPPPKDSAPGILRRRVLALGAATLSLAGLPRQLRAAPEKADVAIVGAGLAGLHAGMLLQDLGLSVLVLESRDRVGGRCLTADDWYNSPDLGGSQVGADYARMIDTCARLGVKLAPGAHMNAPYTPVIDGRMIPATEWPDSPYNRTVGVERNILPHAMFGYYVGQRTPFEDPQAWRTEAAMQYDISIAEWLRRQGASDEAVRLMYEASGRTPLEHRSVLRMLQESARGAMGMKKFSAEQRKELDQYEIASLVASHVVGGTSRLIDAMAAQLGDRIRVNAAVARIEQDDSGCMLRLVDGRSVAADYVIAAAPFSALKSVDFAPGLQGAQADAVANMPYNNQSQIWFEVLGPYWEEDGLDASLWTDGPLQYIRQQIEPDGSRKVMSAIASAEKAAYLDSLAPEERGRFALAEIERIRPSTRGKLRVIGVHSWSEGPSASGCSFELPVGRAGAWIGAMARPHGRVHFAGEHLRKLELGMEAAMESAESAVLEIVQRAV